MAYRLGVKTYLAKPNTIPELTELLQTLIQYWGGAALLPENLATSAVTVVGAERL